MRETDGSLIDVQGAQAVGLDLIELSPSLVDVAEIGERRGHVSVEWAVRGPKGLQRGTVQLLGPREFAHPPADAAEVVERDRQRDRAGRALFAQADGALQQRLCPFAVAQALLRLTQVVEDVLQPNLIRLLEHLDLRERLLVEGSRRARVAGLVEGHAEPVECVDPVGRVRHVNTGERILREFGGVQRFGDVALARQGDRLPNERREGWEIHLYRSPTRSRT